MLGKGTCKAELEDYTILIVRRFKELDVTKQKFKQQMEVVGSIRHENETRLRIAVGTARGIAYIHTQTCGKLVHGNIKASNIFLNSQQHGCVSEHGLATLVNQAVPPNDKIPGYRAPEVTNTSKVSQASDMYSDGVLLLELLTGKSPVYSTGADEAYHLVKWVNSVIREEWTAEVFDIMLLRYLKIEVEMVELLQIAMACTERVVDQRPKMTDVVEIVEDIQRD
ncbi:hypothetical protein LguiA_002294 [Lonicera macranthoides]